MRQIALVVTLVVLLGGGSALADVPTVLNFTGTLHTGAGPFEGGAKVTLSFYPSQQSQTPLWSEEQDVFVQGGRFYVLLGLTPGNPLPASLFDGGEVYLGVRVDNQEEMKPRLRVTSVPYALRAGEAGLLGGLPPGAFALAAHSHSFGDITGKVTEVQLPDSVVLAAELDNILGGYVTNAALQAGLAAKSNVGHQHLLGDVTGLQTALDGKAPLNHHHDDAYVNVGEANSVTTEMIADGTITFADLGANGCSPGKVIKRGQSAWECGDDQNTTYTAGTGLILSNNQFSVVQGTIEGWARGVCYDSVTELEAALSNWDQKASDDLTTLTNFGGALTGTYNSLALAPGVVGNTEIADTTKFLSVQNPSGQEQFAVRDGNPGLRFSAGQGLLVDFDATNRLVSYSPDFGVVQRRVSGQCTGSQYMQTVNDQGGVTCGQDSDTLVSLACPAGGGVARYSGTSWSCVSPLPVALGGTNHTSEGSAGAVVYWNGTASRYDFTAAGTSGQILRSGGSGAPTWGPVDLASTTQVSGKLGIANGGTNSTATPTAGGVAYGTGSAYAFTSAGGSNQVLKGGATAPTWGSVNLLSDVTGILPAKSGGTGVDSQNAIGVPVVTFGAWSFVTELPVTRGGTGMYAASRGDLIVGDGENSYKRLAAAPAGHVLVTTGSVGVGVSWGKVNLQEHVTNTLLIGNGGTGSTTVGPAGSVAYSNGVQYQFTSQGTSGQFLRSTGTTAPTWSSLQASDLPSGSSHYIQNQQSSIQNADFRISGNGHLGGELWVGSASGRIRVHGTQWTATPPAGLEAYGLLDFQTVGGVPLARVGAWTDSANSNVVLDVMAPKSVTIRTGLAGVVAATFYSPKDSDNNGEIDSVSVAHGFHTVGQSAFGATIGGGGSLSQPNFVNSRYATIAGGENNSVSGDHGTVAGGYGNEARGLASVVGGGQYNKAREQGAVIAGGLTNEALDAYSAVAGGSGNTARFFAAVAGGSGNQATGNYSFVAAGQSNAANGNFSFAAGRRAKANSEGCFVWGDSTNSDVTCTVTNQFVARASGGVIFYSNAQMNTGVQLASGGGSWTSVSDRDLKTDFESVDPQEVLDCLVSMPITTWRYISEVSGARHMGPTAQDFYACYGLGDSERHITTIDADGVAFAAIQALHHKVETLTAENAELRERVARLERLLAPTRRR